jgi:hypothetical protein
MRRVLFVARDDTSGQREAGMEELSEERRDWENIERSAIWQMGAT